MRYLVAVMSLLPNAAWAQASQPGFPVWTLCGGQLSNQVGVSVRLEEKKVRGGTWEITVVRLESGSGARTDRTYPGNNVPGPNRLLQRIEFEAGYLDLPFYFGERVVNGTLTLKGQIPVAVNMTCYPGGIRPRGGVSN